MTNKEIVLHSIRYIEKNLTEPLSVTDISHEAHYSLYHFIRLFQSVTGFSPGNYMQQRRLTEAAKKLCHTKKRIIEIAFDFQFGSHEAFTRAFRKQFGINPTEIRNGSPLASPAMVEPLTEEYIFQSEKARNEPPEVMMLPEILMAGVSFFVSDFSKELDFSGIWGQFMNEVSAIENRVKPERYFQVQYWFEKQEAGGLYFFIGVEIDGISGVKPQFVVKTIPAGRYLRFVHKGFANKVGYTYKYIYNQFLPETDYRLISPFSFELYGERSKGPYNEDSESDIFIPIE